MTDNYTITYPSLNLLKEWNQECEDIHFRPYGYTRFIAEKAVEWTHEQLRAANEAELQKARDEELDACVEWLGDAPVVYNDNGELHPGSYLRDARRPKPPSLKEQALAALKDLNLSLDDGHNASTIRKALEQLDD